MFCEKCGAELPEGAHFCDKCGTNVQTVMPEPVEIKPTVVQAADKPEQPEAVQGVEELEKPKATLETPKREGSKKSINKGVIIGIIIAAVVLLLVFFVLKPFEKKTNDLTKYITYTEEEFKNETGIKENEYGSYYIKKSTKTTGGVSVSFNDSGDMHMIDIGHSTNYSVFGITPGQNRNEAISVLEKNGFSVFDEYSAYDQSVALFGEEIEGANKLAEIDKKIIFYELINSDLGYQVIIQTSEDETIYTIKFLYEKIEADPERRISTIAARVINGESVPMIGKDEEISSEESFAAIDFTGHFEDGYYNTIDVYKQGGEIYADIGIYRLVGISGRAIESDNTLTVKDDKVKVVVLLEYSSDGENINMRIKDSKFEYLTNGDRFSGFKKRVYTHDTSDQSLKSEYILPYSGIRKITELDLAGLSSKELTYARNEIYARYGYVFQSPELNNYFAEKKWYYPNSNVNQSALSKLEQQNADFIRQYQDSTGKQYIPNGKETENRNETKNSNIGYSDNELINMARKFYEKTTGHRAPPIIEIDSVTGNNVNIHLYEFIGEPGEEHISTTDWYSVDRYTGKGTNVIGDQIDLTKEF